MPLPVYLKIMGYIEDETPGRKDDRYILTKDAVLLHKQHEIPWNTFISYSHFASSAFALLLEARLRSAGSPPPYIDKNIQGGEEWARLLEEWIEKADNIIFLIGKKTLPSRSGWVEKEIDWAVNAKTQKRIIVVCHNSSKLEKCPDELKNKQGYEIRAEHPSQYEAAISFVLNALGLPTY